MGQHSDDIINGDVDQYTGEWIGNGQGYPRTVHGVDGYRGNIQIRKPDGTYRNIDHDPDNYTKGTKAIRKELAILIESKKAEIENITDKEINRIVGECRQAINTKYGKGWREQF